MIVEEATHTLKELVICFIGLVTTLIFSVMALGIANWGISVFGITRLWLRAQ